MIGASPYIHVIGGGLAGSEAAWQIARTGAPARLQEMRPVVKTAAHKSERLAELVCSNSFRSDDSEANAVGLLHEEMRLANSLVLRNADAHKTPAGGALAVDRNGFSQSVQAAVEAEPLISLDRAECKNLPDADAPLTIVATGPLTSAALADDILRVTGEEQLAFFDAIAPIVYRDTIDFSQAWFQSRYDKPGPGGAGKDYINCPLDKAEYEAFVTALLEGEKTIFKDWEGTPYFEGCLPIEVMAERGRETLRFGPMKPVGLTDPHRGQRSHAVVQLRQDNALGTLFNMVGFQTKLKHGAQTGIFRRIPGLQNAEFARLGGLHRNMFLKSPLLLDAQLRLKARPNLRFAGQITGVEGYVESAAVGLIAGRMAAAEARGRAITPPPATTAHGALIAHITGGATADTFQPMNVNFGLFPPLPDPTRGRRGKQERKAAYCQRALKDFRRWLTSANRATAAA